MPAKCDCGERHEDGCAVLREQYYAVTARLLPMLVKVYEKCRQGTATNRLLMQLKSIRSIQRSPVKAKNLGWKIQDAVKAYQDTDDPSGYDFEVGAALVLTGELIHSRFPITNRDMQRLRETVQETRKCMQEQHIK